MPVSNLSGEMKRVDVSTVDNANCETVSESCGCGAKFACSRVHPPSSYLRSAAETWWRWRVSHALVCDRMRVMIVPELALRKQIEEETRAQDEAVRVRDEAVRVKRHEYAETQKAKLAAKKEADKSQAEARRLARAAQLPDPYPHDRLSDVETLRQISGNVPIYH